MGKDIFSTGKIEKCHYNEVCDRSNGSNRNKKYVWTWMGGSMGVSYNDNATASHDPWYLPVFHSWTEKKCYLVREEYLAGTA
jgi:hypothetical protein